MKIFSNYKGVCIVIILAKHVCMVFVIIPSVTYVLQELPEQELYRPPLTIRCVDCRSFGRFTLVGTHMINSIHKYIFNPLTKQEREAEDRKRYLQQLQSKMRFI